MLHFKFICFLLSVTSLVNSASCKVLDDRDTRIFEGKINQTLEEIKQLIKDGIEELGIPPLDPLKINALEIPVDIHEVLDVDISASDILIRGGSSFVATKLKFNVLTLKLDYTIVVPKIVVGGLYDLDGILLQFIPAFGNGTFGAELTNLELSGHGKLSLFSTRLSMKDFKLVIGLEDIHFSLTGLMDNEVFTQSLVNTLNEDVGPLINNHKEEISQIVSPILEEIFNSILQIFTK